MTVNEVRLAFSELTSKLGQAGICLDKGGYAALGIDGLILYFELCEKEETLAVFAHIGMIPPDADREFYAKLLAANFFHRETCGATIGLDRAAGVVGLFYSIPVAVLDSARLELCVENCANVVHLWSQRLAGGGAQEEPAPAQGAPFSMGIRA